MQELHVHVGLSNVQSLFLADMARKTFYKFMLWYMVYI